MKPPPAPEPTSQGDGQGTTEPLAATMPSGVARPDASSVSPTTPRRGGVPNPAAAAAGPVNRIRAVWQGAQRFDTGREDGPVARLDGTNETGQSPVDALLSALATCGGVDVVEILAKRRTPAERLVIDVTATRRAETPRRVLRFDIEYRIDGAGIERQHAERAISLAIEKYCSVAATLKADIVIETTLTLNGQTGAPVRQPVPA
ncbi:MAG: OsmC family protein [Gemmatimonadota bacterium]|nr:OsmC family protein [Gemmatimonadota bacterium]